MCCSLCMFIRSDWLTFVSAWNAVLLALIEHAWNTRTVRDYTIQFAVGVIAFNGAFSRLLRPQASTVPTHHWKCKADLRCLIRAQASHTHSTIYSTIVYNIQWWGIFVVMPSVAKSSSSFTNGMEIVRMLLRITHTHTHTTVCQRLSDTNRKFLHFHFRTIEKWKWFWVLAAVNVSLSLSLSVPLCYD